MMFIKLLLNFMPKIAKLLLLSETQHNQIYFCEINSSMLWVRSTLINDVIMSRVGAVALYTVLWTVVVKYRKWRFSAPHRTKTP